MTQPRCRARRQRDGRPCESFAMASGVCRVHGGASVRGPRHPSYRHGRYTAVLPVALEARYRAAVADPELLSLGAEVGLVDARVSELLDGVRAGTPTPTRWEQLGAALATFEEVQAAGDVASMRAAFHELSGLIREGATEASTWRDVTDLIERRRRLVRDQRKADAFDKAHVPAPTMNAFVDALLGALLEVLGTDHPELYERSLNSMLAILSRRLGGPLAIEGGTRVSDA